MRSRYAGRPVHHVNRRDRGRARGCQHPHAAAFARPHHRRPPIHPRLQADGHLPQRGAGVHVGGGQGPGPRRGATGDHRVPRPRLPRAGAAEPGTHQGNDGLGGLRARSRRLPARWSCEELDLDGVDPRRPAALPTERTADLPVLVVGCGESGILAGIRLKQANIPFTIVEKNAGPGGTWWENSYPGARVDVANHFYCYSFEPNNDWTHFFAEQYELQDYFTQVMTKHDLAEHIRWNTEVLAAEWNDDDGMWSVSLRSRRRSDRARCARGPSSPRSVSSIDRTFPNSTAPTPSRGRRFTPRPGITRST